MFEKTYKITITVIGIVFAIVAAISLVTRTFDITKAGDKFDLFRDLLLVLLALAAAIGVAMYHLVRDSVKEAVMPEVKTETDKKAKSIEEQVAANLGKLTNEISRERGLRLIITGVDHWNSRELTMGSKRTREALNEEGLTPFDKLLAKSNLGYYLAESFAATHIPQEAKEAKELASEAYNGYDRNKEGYDRPEWVHNWAYVKRITAETMEEKTDLRGIINGFLQREDLKNVRDDLQQELKALDVELENLP